MEIAEKLRELIKGRKWAVFMTICGIAGLLLIMISSLSVFVLILNLIHLMLHYLPFTASLYPFFRKYPTRHKSAGG